MNTKYWIVDKGVDNGDNYPHLAEAANLLADGEVVAFPTETVYGLGADATNDEAVEKIFTAKGRPSDNPLIVHISNKEQLDYIVSSVPEKAKVLMNTFWPGPITFVLPKKEGIASKVTAGLETVAVRMPNHPIALALIEQSKKPIAAPSANVSGRPSPTTAKHVYDDLNGRIAGIVDGGPTGVGVESTVIDCTVEVPVILRPGGVTKEEIEEIIGQVEDDKALLDEKVAPKSPGMKYTHYAPNAPLYIVEGSPTFFRQLIVEKKREGLRVAVLTTKENEGFYKEADEIVVCGQRNQLETVATNLYDALRSFNKMDIDIILSEHFPYEGIGIAIMNRLNKASGHKRLTEKRG
ncbi:MAG: L-threonylcarbamoyladenylate synthase [Bacillaceae bacterium]